MEAWILEVADQLAGCLRGRVGLGIAREGLEGVRELRPGGFLVEGDVDQVAVCGDVGDGLRIDVAGALAGERNLGPGFAICADGQVRVVSSAWALGVLCSACMSSVLYQVPASSELCEWEPVLVLLLRSAVRATDRSKLCVVRTICWSSFVTGALGSALLIHTFLLLIYPTQTPTLSIYSMNR